MTRSSARGHRQAADHVDITRQKIRPKDQSFPPMIMVGLAVMLAGGLLLVGAVGISLFQCVRWFRKGTWTGYPVGCWRDGAPRQSGRAGMANIVATGLSTLPLSVATALVAFPVMTIGALIFLAAPY